MGGNQLLVVMMAAGKGTRMKSRRSKLVHEVLGRPLVAWALDPVFSLMPREVVMVVGHDAEGVIAGARAHADAAQYTQQGGALAFVTQPEQLGTGHAVMCARAEIERHLKTARETQEKPVILIGSGDMPCIRAETLQAFISSHNTSGALLSIMSAHRPTDVKFGRVIRDLQGRVTRVVEYRDASADERNVTEMNMGVYLADAAFLLDSLTKITPDNDQKEYYLTDVVAHAAAQHSVAAFAVSDPTETLGVNDRIDLADASESLRIRILRHWMREGVTVTDPLHCLVEPTVTLGRDITLEPGVILKGNTRLADGVVVGAGSVLIDTTAEEDSVFLPYTVAESAHVGASSHVGPFARLRPGTHLGRDCKVGNFVEMKKVTFGDGAKASHLTYLGDATVGADSNIGCGTITCNYDGVFKHETHIGDGVFVGSDTQLVAPVTVGDRVIIAAGSTVTKDVPAGALYMNREPATIKEGWADKRWADLKAKKAADKASAKK